MAAAAVVSAGVAVLALVLSIIGLVRSVSASKDAQAAREGATSAQWKMSEHLAAIAEAQAQAARSGTAPLPRSGGRLSARLVKRGRGERLVIANVGTMPLTVEAVELDQPEVIVERRRGEVAGTELDPGEEYALMAALTMGVKLPLAVKLRWRDETGGHERTQRVTLS